MLVRKLYWLFLLLVAASYSFFPDDTDIKNITARLDKFRKSYPQEKVHLHIDKPFYSTGDTLYFTGYVVNAEKNLPSVISNVLYVDVVKDTGVTISTLMFPITDGIAWGSVIIPDTMQDGAYRLRAYTNWMRNFDNAFFGTQTIAIGAGFKEDIIADATYQMDAANLNKDAVIIHYHSLHELPLEGKEIRYGILAGKKEISKGKATIDSQGDMAVLASSINLKREGTTTLLLHMKTEGKTINKQLQLSLPAMHFSTQFFPEGGQMIAGIPARIGFKALDATGSGADVSGKINDENESEIASFQSGFKGVGSFSFTPQSGHRYYGVITYKNGSEQKVDLPVAEEYGYALSVHNESKDEVRIHIAAKSASTAADKVWLVAQCNQRVQYSSAVSLANNQADLVLPKKKFATGILQFTLFDTAQMPVAERLIFVNQNDALHIETKLDKTSYGKRDKVVMKLHVTDKNKNPVQGSFSLAVTDANIVAQNESERNTILSDLLLTSDLKGFVERPTYYFTHTDVAKVKALDNLLLTQGWRRFSWKDILNDKYPSTPFPVEKSLRVKGKVVTKGGEPVAGSRVTLLSKGDNREILDTVSDANGNFVFDELFFTDNNPFLLKASRVKGNVDVQVKLEPFSPPHAADSLLASRQPDGLLPYLKYSIRQYDEKRKQGWIQDKSQLKEVVVTSTKQTLVQQAVAPSSNLNGPGRADQILTYADLINCHDLSTCLQGKLIGIYFRLVVEDPAARVKIYHMKPFSSGSSGNPMNVIVDGADVTDKTFDVRSLTPYNIQSIEVLRTGAYLSVYGMRAAGGALIITTKRGNIDYDAALQPSKPVTDDFIVTTAQGYAYSREFYTPDYESPAARNASAQDLRSTIFWKPDITTDEEGNAVVEWFNADTNGTCNVMIEGLSVEGKAGVASLSYPVKQ